MFAAVHAAGALVMADISTLQEAKSAMREGADIVGTTLSGYTPHSRQLSGPDWVLLDELRGAGVPFVAEGRLNTPAEAARAMRAGAA